MEDTLDAEHATDASTTDEETPVLAVNDLGHAYGDVDVFSGVEFSLAPGSVTAVVGPNGSGKTTLLRSVLGLLAPQEGSVTLSTADENDRRIGYLPQNPSFRAPFSVAETLEFYAALLDREVDVG